MTNAEEVFKPLSGVDARKSCDSNWLSPETNNGGGTYRCFLLTYRHDKQ
jgi:hypothetical protein